MFTGIIEAAGKIAAAEPTDSGARLHVELPFAADLQIGESVAVNGCCLTVAEVSAEAGIADFDLLAETIRATNLGDLAPGSTVNLERALRAGDRMSGHVVQGHVDAPAEVVAYERRGTDHRLEIALPEGCAQYVAYKGSVAVDGISLTVAEVDDGAGTFTLWIIPHTHRLTTLRSLAAGMRVNLEFDVLAKYVERILAIRG
ncbi:riboflavin synthase [soil metagenome]